MLQLLDVALSLIGQSNNFYLNKTLDIYLYRVLAAKQVTHSKICISEYSDNSSF